MVNSESLLGVVRMHSSSREEEGVNLIRLLFDQLQHYRVPPQLIEQKGLTEEAAYQTACRHFGEVFALVLYDVVTLYFESHELH